MKLIVDNPPELVDAARSFLAELHRVTPTRPTTYERRLNERAEQAAARDAFGCPDLDGPARHITIRELPGAVPSRERRLCGSDEGAAPFLRISPPINLRAVGLTVAVVYVLLVGALAVTL